MPQIEKPDDLQSIANHPVFWAFHLIQERNGTFPKPLPFKRTVQIAHLPLRIANPLRFQTETNTSQIIAVQGTFESAKIIQ